MCCDAGSWPAKVLANFVALSRALFHPAGVKLLLLCSLLLGVGVVRAEEPVTLTVDFSKNIGTLRALHGVNKGPLMPGGLIDLTEAQKALGIPLTRLHDCHWPVPDVVDMHVVFPNPEADPADPKSYNFGATDEYVTAVRATGAQIVYRLGESIEHTTIKRFVHPPKDLTRWSAAAVGIIRHYHEGWAGGRQDGMRYWEIWNEPENRPVMWSGNDDQFLDLYATASRAIRAQVPGVLVGGPAFGASGSFVNGQFRPTEFVEKFLSRCQREGLPLDFFSWHCYTNNPSELVARAKAIRQLLDAHGFTKTESHLNEWNYLPGNSWKPISKSGAPEARQKHYEEMAGAPGAAFITAALLELQDAPLDAANLFHGEAGGFGLFNENGVKMKNYYALLAFHELLRAPQRVAVDGAQPGKLAVAAGTNEAKDGAAVLVSNFAGTNSQIRIAWPQLPWNGPTTVEVRVVDATRNLVTTVNEVIDRGSLDLSLPAPGVALVVLRNGAK